MKAWKLEITFKVEGAEPRTKELFFSSKAAVHHMLRKHSTLSGTVIYAIGKHGTGESVEGPMTTTYTLTEVEL